MGMLSEFKAFAMSGSLVDIAVGVVMGGAFGKIVSAFTDGMVMPIVGLLTSGQDFSKMAYELVPAKMEGGKVVAEAVAVKYGVFLTTVLDFLVVAWVVFMIVKAMNASKKKEAAAPAAPPAQEVLLGEIRDLLSKGR